MRHDLRLTGEEVGLAPLRVTDAADLAAGTDAGDLPFHTAPPPVDQASARANIEVLLADATTRAFAVRSTATGQWRGMTAFYELVSGVPRVEIGHTHYPRAFWGGRTNPAVKLLMLAHAFEAWGCARVALRCDSANDRSVAAIRRLGARPEGVLRRHRRRYDGTVADTAYFSLLDSDWAAARSALEARLAR